MRVEKSAIKCESLDYVEAVHRDKIYPLMYCHMELDKNLDIDRLQTAIVDSCKYVPETLYRFDFAKKWFVDQGFTADNVIHYASDLKQWALNQKPQLQIAVDKENKRVIIGMSHILADGYGFLQYLYLLCCLYNEYTPILPLENDRDIAPIIKNVHVKQSMRQIWNQRKIVVPPLREKSNGKQYFCLYSRISSKDFSTLSDRSREYMVTLNDIFITAYARIISHRDEIRTVVIPCPANLRKYSSIADQLTIANMTGVYRQIVVEVEPQHSFEQTLLRVHKEMELQKSEYRCFIGIRSLDYAFSRIPSAVLVHGVKCFYRPSSVSYTNFGKIDHRKMYFEGCNIKNCYMTGTYRLPPDFQLSISTYQNVCTLNCTLIGEEKDQIIGQHIIDEIKNEIMEWIERNTISFNEAETEH